MESTELKKEAANRPSDAFDIFLSYSRKDRDFAARLESALESYRFPKSLKSVKRSLNVFRDESDIQAAGDYHRTIEQHLKSSVKMVVVCSPDARKSGYVEDEIRRFIESHDQGDIIPVLVRGKANNETVDESEKAFPEVLCENRMPLAANFLGCDSYKGRLDKGSFRSAFYSILAALNGIDRRRLEQIDEKVRARRRALTLGTAVAIILFLSVALVVALVSQQKAVAATNNATRSAAAEEKAKNEAIAAAKAEREAKDEAIGAAKAERKAKDEAIAAARAEKKAKDGAIAAAKAEKKAKDEAIAQKKATEQLLYAADMSLAHRAHEARDMPRVYELLKTHIPTSISTTTPTRQDDLRSFYWYYLWRNSYPELKVLQDQEPRDFPRYSVSLSPNGRTLAKAIRGHKVGLWDLSTGQPLEPLILSGPSNDFFDDIYVTSVAFSPDGNMLAGGTSDGRVIVWDMNTRLETATLEWRADSLDKARGSVHAVAFSPDGCTLASGNGDNTVTLWDVCARKELDKLGRGYISQSVNAVAFAPDGTLLASGSTDARVTLWEVKSRKVVAILKGHTDTVEAVAFSPDGRKLASGGGDDTVRLWDLSTLPSSPIQEVKEMANFKLGEGGSTSVAFSPDGRTLASGTYYRVKLWDVSTREELATLGQGRSVAFSPDGKTLAGASQTVTLWDVGTRLEITTLEGKAKAMASVTLSRDGTTLACANVDNTAANRDNTVSLWDVRTGQAMSTLKGDLRDVQSVALSPDGTMLASGSADSTVNLWDVSTGKHLETVKGHVGSVISLSFFADGKTLASGSVDNTVKLWDLRLRREVATLGSVFQHLPGLARGAMGSMVQAVALSANGNMLACATSEGTVRVWDVNLRHEVATLKVRLGPVMSVTFSPDDKTLAAGGSEVRLWNTSTWDEMAPLKEHSGQVNSVAFSPDGRTLASAGSDKTVKLWDTSTWKELATLKGYSGSVLTVAFAVNKTKRVMLVSASAKAIKLWYASTGEEVAAESHP